MELQKLVAKFLGNQLRENVRKHLIFCRNLIIMAESVSMIINADIEIVKMRMVSAKV